MGLFVEECMNHSHVKVLLSVGLLESGKTETRHGCEAVVQSDRGGSEIDAASEKEGGAVTATGTESGSVSVTERQ